jgi:dipeptidyl aminopeptidase/acylaminoacyl peptidase
MRLTDAEAAEYSPIRFVSPGAAPSLIVHGDADTTVPLVEGETMHAALIKAGVPASFIRIEGAGHGFEGANLERASAAMAQWFEQYLGVASPVRHGDVTFSGKAAAGWVHPPWFR